MSLKKATIQIKRGKKYRLPKLYDGELAYCTDTKELYIGYNGINEVITGSSGTGVVQDVDGGFFTDSTTTIEIDGGAF